ncbi:MAG TPA: helix-turn-helix domain-containing protein [Polyangiaceae bacterium]|nr:helix-turn-helix domain-containing protein [Polyangiaceae bacterium]
MTLGMNQAEFGPALGWSHRTAVRWERGRATPTAESLVKLASLLAPIDLDLAAEIAATVGQTLESLGIVAPAAKPGPTLSPADLSDLVVCAAADAADLAPRALRSLLYAAFARARALGLSVEQVEESLRVRVDSKGGRNDVPRPRVRVERESEDPAAEPAAERRPRSRSR